MAIHASSVSHPFQKMDGIIADKRTEHEISNIRSEIIACSLTGMSKEEVPQIALRMEMALLQFKREELELEIILLELKKERAKSELALAQHMGTQKTRETS